MKIIRIDDTVVTRWSGGTTTQLLIEPEDAVYADRDFLWRLSTAEVEDEESTFTCLPDYRRFLSIRRGKLSLCHGDNRWYTLEPGQVTEFDGGETTVSRGQVTDYNLMLKKGSAAGDMQAEFLEGGRHVRLTDVFPSWRESAGKAWDEAGDAEKKENRNPVWTLFLSEGPILRLFGNYEEVLHTGEMAVFRCREEIERVWLEGEERSLVIGSRIQ